MALKKLRAKDRFESEIRGFLEDFPAEIIESVIQILKERRIIEDTRTTINLVERNSGKRSIGQEKLCAELLERGAPEETIHTALRSSSANEGENILDVLSAKFLPERFERAKAARYLFSRGFKEDDIESALDRFFQV